MDLLAQVVAGMPYIATQDSGVSWGALLAVLGAISTIGVAAITVLFNYIKGAVGEIKVAVSEARTEFTALANKLDEKVEKVEESSRSARASQWQEHNSLRDRVTSIEATVNVMSQRTPVASNPPVT